MVANTAHESVLRTAVAELGMDLPPDQIDALLRFNDLLQRWNTVYNLTAVRDSTSALSLHVIDCLAAVPSLRRQMALLKGRCLVDVGSGGGLPGVIFAITDRSMRVTCVDSVGKKAAFVTQVAGELGLPNLTSVHRRVEELNGPFSVIASRAFSSLQNFARVTGHLLSPEGVWMAMKGKVPSEEIADLGRKISVFHVEHLTVPGSSADRCLVWMQPSAATNQPESR